MSRKGGPFYYQMFGDLLIYKFLLAHFPKAHKLSRIMDSTFLKTSVIGCGWLGRPLCETLQSKGYDVTTTTSQTAKKKELDAHFRTLLYNIGSDAPEESLLNANVIIYTIPPLGLKEVEGFFSNVPREKKIIFISSTSIFGKSIGICDEKSPSNPDTKNGKLLVESERFLRQNFTKATILRPGGLFGEFNKKLRHPIYFLQGKQNLENGSEWLHLVDGHDCIQAILNIIEKNLWNDDFNLINDLRLKKSEYYPQIAKNLDLEPPHYLEHSLANPTKISNEKSKKILSIVYNNT